MHIKRVGIHAVTLWEAFLIPYENDEIKEKLKDSLLSQAEALVNKLMSNPDSINKIEVIKNIVLSLNNLYPDSASTQKIIKELERKKSRLDTQYQVINKDFQTARTYFANAKLSHPEDPFYETAYQYSNSLFPLQGRIDFAEKNNNLVELEKAQKMLNIFQYKIMS